VSVADALIEQIDGMFSGSERGSQFTPAISQLETFLITSVRLSLVTRSVSTSGWRLISSAPNPLNSRDTIPIRPTTNQVLCP